MSGGVVAALLAAAVSGAGGLLVLRRRAPAGVQDVLTLDELRELTPRLTEAKRVEYLPYINQALREWDITSYARVTAWLGQMLFESNQFAAWREVGDASAYEGRASLGNTQPGDGERFRGRGPVQLTGRDNYTRAGKALGLPLATQPELVERPEVGFRTAAWFWRSGNGDLNPYADLETDDAYLAITRRINGGTNGLEQRRNYWTRAKAALSSRRAAT
ncbi:hypothetical protein LY474_40495 [Myxococcus stipitatus]|uniref:glycoside hydrolase family 19 protein n=1 Tax=Myxococcus stipitatus TaxID=83455 RepID=UPI001F2296AF|nr:glycoside hydrolase family 19 protein [Myxococcus stipitatus]MCE9674088.1 hypothetical protein [Myxococcus stipitatus]